MRIWITILALGAVVHHPYSAHAVWGLSPQPQQLLLAARCKNECRSSSSLFLLGRPQDDDHSTTAATAASSRQQQPNEHSNNRQSSTDPSAAASPLSLDTAAAALAKRVRTNDTSLVQVEGYVTAKRGFGSSFLFLDISQRQQQQQGHTTTNNNSPIAVPVVQAMLKRQDFDHTHSNSFDGCRTCIVPGIKVLLTGLAAPTRQAGEAVVLIRTMEIRGLPRNPQHVRMLLQAAAKGCIQLPSHLLAAAAAAARSSSATNNHQSWSELLRVRSNEQRTHDDSHKKSAGDFYYNLAKEIVAALPDDPNYPYELIRLQSQQQPKGNSRSSSNNDEPVYVLPAPPPEIQKTVKRLLASTTRNDGIIATHPPCFSVTDVVTGHCRTKAITTTTTLPERAVVVSIMGWVQNRRRFDSAVAVVEVVNEMVRASQLVDKTQQQQRNAVQEHDKPNVTTQDMARIKCVLHPLLFAAAHENSIDKDPNDPSDNMHSRQQQQHAKMWGNLLAPGSHVVLQGYLERNTSNDESSSQCSIPMLWITSARLLRASWRPTVVRYVLDMVVQGALDATQAAHALGVSDQEMESIVQRNDAAQRHWKSAEISRSLQDSETRLGTVTPDMLNVLHDASRMAHDEYPIKVQAPPPTTFTADSASSSPNPQQNGAHTTDSSRFKSKKEPQLEWMTQQVEWVVRSHPEFQTRPLQILDIGGGQGFLANFLAERLGGLIEIQVVDIAAGAVHNGAMRSKRRQLKAVSYLVGDASTLEFANIDIVVALHACGALTDVALGHAVVHQAAFVICPCCFRSNPHLSVPVPSIDNDHQKSWPKGGGTVSSLVSVEEWLGFNGDKYDILTRLAEVQGDLALASEATHAICALRARAVQRRFTTKLLQVEIKNFPIAFSTRNFCLVGKLKENQK